MGNPIDDIIQSINDVLAEARVDEPAGRGAGWMVEYDEDFMRKVISKLLPPGFEWINEPVTVTGEDFTYEATCLCSFPKTNGKVRYIVEDRGRLFIQRESQLQWPQDLVTVAVPDDMDNEAAGKPSVNSQEYLRAQSELKNRLVSLPGCPHCGYRHPPDGVCLK